MAEAEDHFYHDELEYYGHIIMIDAAATLDYPLPIQEIKIKGAGLNPEQVFDILRLQFDLHPTFQLNNHETFYISYGANMIKDNYGYTSAPYFHAPINQYLPVLDPVLAAMEMSPTSLEKGLIWSVKTDPELWSPLSNAVFSWPIKRYHLV